MLKVVEIFTGIQGESSFAGLPCTFVRLHGCNLNCVWCDTLTAKQSGNYAEMSVADIAQKIRCTPAGLAEITGGEPLLQPETPKLCSRLLEAGLTVLAETNGSVDLSVLPDKIIKIVDYKLPASGEHGSFLSDNFHRMTMKDEMKFVVSDQTDFQCATEVIEQEHLEKKTKVLFSPVCEKITPADLAHWILDAGIQARLNLQLHKIIWKDRDEEKRYC